jgi:hypothetical protein
MSAIERRVDFLGVPVKHTVCQEGYYEELSRPYLIMREGPPLKTQGDFKGVKVLSDEKVSLENGYYSFDFIIPHLAQSFTQEITVSKYQPTTIEGKDIRKLVKGPRRWNGTRVTFRSIDDSVASTLPIQEPPRHRTKTLEEALYPENKQEQVVYEGPNPFTPIVQRILNGGKGTNLQELNEV